jgi:hypothetical protein
MTETRNSYLNKLQKLVPDWERLSGESGHQHNGQHLGKHTANVIDNVMADRRFSKLPAEYQEVVILAAFFHDMGKPTGRPGEVVPRLISHESKSAMIAVRELKNLDVPSAIIHKVRLLILHDNLMSEYGRTKLHGQEYFSISNRPQNSNIVIARSPRRGNLLKRFPREVPAGGTSLGMTFENNSAPSVISKRFNQDKHLLTALLILNKADVIAAGKGSGKPGRWGKIRPWVTEYFNACMKEAK